MFSIKYFCVFDLVKKSVSMSVKSDTRKLHTHTMKVLRTIRISNFFVEDFLKILKFQKEYDPFFWKIKIVYRDRNCVQWTVLYTVHCELPLLVVVRANKVCAFNKIYAARLDYSQHGLIEYSTYRLIIVLKKSNILIHNMYNLLQVYITTKTLLF